MPIMILSKISPKKAPALLEHTNLFIIWFLFNIHIVHLIAFGVHICGYFSKENSIANILLSLGILSIFMPLQHYYQLYVGVFFPILLLRRAISEIFYYETIGEYIQWDNLFVAGELAYGVHGSLGMTFILTVIGIIIHFLLAKYVYTVNPGQYGVRKDLLYFLKKKNNETTENEMENIEYNNAGFIESDSEEMHIPSIQIRNLKRTYNIGLFNKSKIDALQGLSVDFFKGEITSVLGHNGAGKTTMISILTGMTGLSSGLVLVNSKNIKNHMKEIKSGFGLSSQEVIVFRNLTVKQQLHFFAKVDKIRFIIWERVKQKPKLNLNDKQRTLPLELSGGQQKKLCLGIALAGDPSILILDKPTSGLDPENKHAIWDMLLKMRGEKTILISTHDIEEADILGDKIAMLHAGQLIAYGSSMFLKKIIGENKIEVTLSIEPSCDPETVLRELSSDGKIINQDRNKLVISIPDSTDLPDSLDKLEKNKEQLGISGFSISDISLRQVFLKLTDENKNVSITTLPTNKKLVGKSLWTQSIRALLRKKLVFTMKNTSLVIILLIKVFIALFCSSYFIKELSHADTELSEAVDIDLEMYHRPQTFYKSYNSNFSEHYRYLTNSFGGTAIKSKDSSISITLLNYAKQDVHVYDNHVIAAAELNQTGSTLIANALYSGKASYSLPISINLFSNTILKTLAGKEYSINISTQKLPTAVDTTFSTVLSIIGASILCVFFNIMFFNGISVFVRHPWQENSSGIKHLQQMTGVSHITYWGTMFVFDLIAYFIVVIIIMIMSTILDHSFNLQIYRTYEILILFVSFFLFALNFFPIIYIFSFVGKAGVAEQILASFPLLILFIDLFLIFVLSTTLRDIQRTIFLLIPHVSFTYGQIYFYMVAGINARCRKLPNYYYDTVCKTKLADICCAYECYDGYCKNQLSYFEDYEIMGNTLNQSWMYMGLTSILYFGILVILEYQIIQKYRIRYKRQIPIETVKDEQVKNEKSKVAQRISTLREETENINPDDRLNYFVFLVYELRKRYKHLLAVKDISFGVYEKECFGLLGVNGAGKSTAFRMMTGEEIPDNGIMYIHNKDFKYNRNYCLSQTAYCPQQDVQLDSFNAFDHLRLFGCLRGIPEDEVEVEVNNWIEWLNLTPCASQPSGTYSGGNKRRLNIAIALIGVPKLVFMDEPTTGVDPGARRLMWNILKSYQDLGNSIILTSHSMEECEILCNRIAIMVDGKFVCIGPSQELKQRFGAGYDVRIKMNPEKAKDQIDELKSDMTQSLECSLIDENSGYLMYHVKPNDVTWRKMHDVMNEMKSKYDCIDDFTIFSSSLEQLFLLFTKFAGSGDAE